MGLKAFDLLEACPELELSVFTDRDILEDPDRVAQALETADAFFASLIFDYEQVTWGVECSFGGRLNR